MIFVKPRVTCGLFYYLCSIIQFLLMALINVGNKPAFIALHQHYIRICLGHVTNVGCGAALLNYFEHYTDAMMSRAGEAGCSRDEWRIKKSYKQLQYDVLFGAFSQPTIIKTVRELYDAGYIDVISFTTSTNEYEFLTSAVQADVSSATSKIL